MAHFKLLTKGIILIMILGLALFAGNNAFAQDTLVTMSDTVTTALEYSPRLQVLQANQEAIGYERDRAKGGYYPQVDVAFGYGIEAHSAPPTRANNTENNFYDRMEASIRLSQLLYDGSEVSSRVAVEDAKLKSAAHRVTDNAEAIALDALIAHMEVYRQRELVGLAQKNVNDHLEILDMLNERQQGGAGTTTDINQTQTRLARANASLVEAKAALEAAKATYQQIVGKLAGDLEFFVVPADMLPATLDDAIIQAVDNNPKIRALSSNIEEAESRVNLSRSNFLPKVHAELSSSYEDQVELSETYEHNNQAMVRLRWNVFNGHSDVADRKAALARKAQATANRNDQQDQIIAEVRTTWAELESARAQSVAYGDAMNYSQNTLKDRMDLFREIGQASLLDILDTRNELFQSSGLLVTSKTNEVIAAERLLALTGKLNASLGIDEKVYVVQQ